MFLFPKASSFWHICQVTAWTANPSSCPDKVGKGQFISYLVGKEEIINTSPFLVIFFECIFFWVHLLWVLFLPALWNKWILYGDPLGAGCLFLFVFIKSFPSWTNTFLSHSYIPLRRMRGILPRKRSFSLCIFKIEDEEVAMTEIYTCSNHYSVCIFLCAYIHTHRGYLCLEIT